MKKKINLLLKKIAAIALTVALGLGIYKHIQRKAKKNTEEKILELNNRLKNDEEISANELKANNINVYEQYIDENNNLDKSITELSIEEPDEEETVLPDPNKNEEIVDEYVESLTKEEVEEESFQYTK